MTRRPVSADDPDILRDLSHRAWRDAAARAPRKLPPSPKKAPTMTQQRAGMGDFLSSALRSIYPPRLSFDDRVADLCARIENVGGDRPAKPFRPHHDNECR